MNMPLQSGSAQALAPANLREFNARVVAAGLEQFDATTLRLANSDPNRRALLINAWRRLPDDKNAATFIKRVRAQLHGAPPAAEPTPELPTDSAAPDDHTHGNQAHVQPAPATSTPQGRSTTRPATAPLPRGHSSNETQGHGSTNTRGHSSSAGSNTRANSPQPGAGDDNFSTHANSRARTDFESRQPNNDSCGTPSRTRPMDQESASTGQRRFDQVGVFGRDRVGATALQFDCSLTQDEDYKTINLSIGRAKGTRTQDGVDWANKICLMLSPGECFLCLNVLMGLNKSFRGAGHGRNNKKWFQIAESEGDYEGTIFVSIAEGEDQRGCSIGPGDLMQVICIVQRAILDQAKASESNIEPLSMRDIMRRVGAMQDRAMASEVARKAKKPARG